MGKSKAAAAAQLREEAKLLLRSSGNEPEAVEKRRRGLQLLSEAAEMKDPEACFLIADLSLRGVIKSKDKDPEKTALLLMTVAANRGSAQARAYLNRYCERRYTSVFAKRAKRQAKDCLLDHNGEPIRIDRRGIRTPIDAVLTTENGRHTLTLSVNVQVPLDECITDPAVLNKAVVNGLRAWEGSYQVFGGQELQVRLNITGKDRLYDHLMIVPVTKEVQKLLGATGRLLAGEDGQQAVTSFLKPRRSFIMFRKGWSVTSRKIIYLFSSSGRFDEYDELMHVVKHEFGHALGLGDLYAEDAKSFKGVAKGTYAELDSYAITDKIYNLVMCDHHGPISNNDIEMVLLAFSKNKAQLYQKRRKKDQISEALGKGN